MAGRYSSLQMKRHTILKNASCVLKNIYCLRGHSHIESSHSLRQNDATLQTNPILKKYVSKYEIYFCLKKKSNVQLNKKVIFVSHTIFKLDFITQIIYSIVRRCLYSLFIIFCSLISVSKKRNIETMLTLSIHTIGKSSTTK